SSIDVEIRVSPSTARVSIDGKVVDNPLVKQLASDDAAHSIRATAPGYNVKETTVSFNANVTLDWSLERQAPPPPPPPRGPAIVRRPPDPRRPDPPRPDPAPARVPDPTPAVQATRPADAPQPRPIDTTPPPDITANPPGWVDPAGGSKPRRPIDPKNPY